jgi:hypothetical protein
VQYRKKSEQGNNNAVIQKNISGIFTVYNMVAKKELIVAEMLAENDFSIEEEGEEEEEGQVRGITQLPVRVLGNVAKLPILEFASRRFSPQVN